MNVSPQDRTQTYRSAVDRIFQQLDQAMDVGGKITDPARRKQLDSLRQRLGLSIAEAEAIEAQVQKPYRVRAEQRRRYALAFKTATKQGYLPTERYRHRLQEYRQHLGLGAADASRIEAILTRQLNLEPLAGELAKTVSQQVTRPQPTPGKTPPTHQHPRYRPLGRYLQGQQWREADQETTRLIGKRIGKGDNHWFTADELRTFPCDELGVLDYLWSHYSQGRFGFGVQYRLWRELGKPSSNNLEGWDQFCIRVGWQPSTASHYFNYTDLQADPHRSPQGEFPCWRIHTAWTQQGWGGMLLLQRWEMCTFSPGKRG